MPIFSRLAYQFIRWKSRRGLRDESENVDSTKRTQKQRTGIRGETFAYWFLRTHGYVFVARNYHPVGAKGEVDLIGYDGETLAFVGVRNLRRYRRSA